MFGIDVIVTPDVPRMQLSPDVPLTDEFRREFNAWMASFFGWTNPLEDGEMWRAQGKLFMNPRTYAELKRELPALCPPSTLGSPRPGGLW